MRTMHAALVTGGAGFIGSELVRQLLHHHPALRVVTLDALTYAGSLRNLDGLSHPGRHTFVQADVGDVATVRQVLADHGIDTIFHLAAESHVDRSIHGPRVFVRTNVEGTASMLEAAHAAWTDRPPSVPPRFHQVSTDEVYGDREGRAAAREEDPYAPSSPYAASKAAADHLVWAWRRTYGLPVSITWGSNTHGVRQFPEKLVPVVVRAALRGEPIPVYGDGQQVRDWISVHDHAAGILAAATAGAEGRGWNLGSGVGTSNDALVGALCEALDHLRPAGAPHARWVRRVADRPGHDRAYAMDVSRAAAELGWKASAHRSSLQATVNALLEAEI